ncbi:MAG: hypothetical protein HY589_05440, partial [Candidatus Omnitrophica bacterium]|nr:hypothetical protein [Candidatus Omnitrophota bacterium]
IDRSRSLNIKGFIYSERKNEAGIIDSILSAMKSTKDFNYGFGDIRLSAIEKASAYEKGVISFSIKCDGQPLKSGDYFAGKK